MGEGGIMPVLDREEYIEQAYFFNAFRERLLDGMPAQEVLARVGEELLSTTRLPLAISFLATEIKVSGLMGPAMARISHYFTPFQTHVINQAELDVSRFPIDQALLILEREAKFRAEGPGARRPVRLPVRVDRPEPPRLLPWPGGDGRRSVRTTKTGSDYILTIQYRARLGDVDFADLIYRPLGLLRRRSPQADFRIPIIGPSIPPSSARRRARSPAPIGAATRCTSSPPSSASSATPRSRASKRPDEA